MRVKPSSAPMSGERTMKRPVFSKNGTSSAWKPASTLPACVARATTAAPASPPSSACDDDVGSPHHHVSRSRTTAPTSAAATRGTVTTCASTPLAMLPATCVLKSRNAMKLKNAAHTTATRGLSTRVDTTVAIEFAASWNPLMKSNARARAMTRTSVSMGGSRVFEHHAFDDVGDVLAAVGRLLDVVEDVAPLHDVDGVVAVVKQLRDGAPVDGVGLVLEAVDLDADVEQLLALRGELREQRHGLVHVAARLQEHARQVHRRGAHRLDLEEDEALGDGLDEVEHVVELRDEAVDVEAVERRDPRLVQALDRVVRELVARALLLADLQGELLLAVHVLEHLEEQLGRLDAAGRVLGERVEEDVVPGFGAEHAGRTLEGEGAVTQLPSPVHITQVCETADVRARSGREACARASQARARASEGALHQGAATHLATARDSRAESRAAPP